MSSNLLKRSYTNLAQDDTRVINVNDLMARRMEELAAKRQENPREGFVSGLMADVIDTDAYIENSEEAGSCGVIKAGADFGALKEEAEREAAEILERARAQAAEIEQMAAVQAQQEKTRVLEQARQQGYADGLEQMRQETARMEAELKEKERQLEASYQSLIEELEPQFVDTITGIYEHIFKVELGNYREVLGYLISTTMRRSEGSRDFLVHVSKEDYSEVSAMKKQITEGVISPNCSVEFVEDITLSQNECLIETDGGIFDCGLGTQLTELRQKLRLLSYERN